MSMIEPQEEHAAAVEELVREKAEAIENGTAWDHLVSDDLPFDAEGQTITSRLLVPGGRLYREIVCSVVDGAPVTPAVALTFVPSASAQS